MVKDEKVLAAINLQAVLRSMEDLCDIDKEARELAQVPDVSIRFSVSGLDKMVLRFSNGKCKAERNGKDYNMNLYFPRAENLNLMMNGKKNPIPTKGFRHIGYLKKNFSTLGDLLSVYLRPDTIELETNNEFLRESTILMAYTAFFALAEIGNLDEIGRLSAQKMEDGIILVEVENSIAISIKAENGHLTATKGRCSNPRAVMSFDSLETVHGILMGQLDSYGCIGSGKLKLKGRIPMLDNMNKLLSLVSTYLGEEVEEL